MVYHRCIKIKLIIYTYLYTYIYIRYYVNHVYIQLIISLTIYSYTYSICYIYVMRVYSIHSVYVYLALIPGLASPITACPLRRPIIIVSFIFDTMYAMS